MASAAAIFPRIKLGGPEGLEVSRIGLGCIGMSGLYNPPKPEPEMIRLIHNAVDSGVTFFDTSDFYGPHTVETLFGHAFRGMREKVEIATKFGVRKKGVAVEIRGDPEYVRDACEASLKRLMFISCVSLQIYVSLTESISIRLNTDCIDLYYVNRIDTRLPIELTMGELKKLVEEGKIKHIGLSEASASTIRRAHAVHPITAVQIEWSLWTRDSENEIIPTCRELGIGIVPYGPLGRGFLAAGPTFIQNWSKTDLRKKLPRFKAKNLEQNKKIYEQMCEMAAEKGHTPAQLALAWVVSQGDDVCPIPGTTKIENLHHNMGALFVELTPQEKAQLESYACADMVMGDRHVFMWNTWMNSDTPQLSNWKAGEL